MSTYSSSDYKLQLVNDFQLLTVSDLSTCQVVASFQASEGLKISYLEDAATGVQTYEIEEDTCSSCYPQEFDPAIGHTVEFSQNRMIGVTVIRIEDGGFREIQYDYNFQSCPLYLDHNGSILTVRTTANLAGDGPDSSCVTITEQVLVNP